MISVKITREQCLKVLRWAALGAWRLDEAFYAILGLLGMTMEDYQAYRLKLLTERFLSNEPLLMTEFAEMVEN